MPAESVHAELKNFRASIPPEMLRKWESPTGAKCLLKLMKDWGMIVAGHQLFVRQPSPATLLAGLLLMSWGQRGLSTLAHDSIHMNLFKNKKLNHLVANLALAPPAMSTANQQRNSHNAHHWYLGTAEDPDHGDGNDTSLRHYRNGVYEHQSFPSLVVYDMLDFKLFRQHVIGSFFDAPLFLTVWWATVSFLTLYLQPANSNWTFAGSSRISSFVVLFHLSRCTFTYAFYVLREIVDHSGLPQDSVLAFTRSSPANNWFQRFLQPHDDNYHLLHHLLPRVPMSKLREADDWLMQHNAEYAEANHYDTYLDGKNALFKQILHVQDGKKRVVE
ncbi:Fatty acid desaturase, type 1 [Moelleriella libera RCEF 2490]|uniref:Fatty acid desaturase, type 1 n=1 Tax=Moelleriella libera RCEF 2490 TaxID=1081109 RepID=A0A167ZNA7_9HYPO|nr:Fatty acid desaturase, type 1 [Moelleriella libera RCEF 2490]